MDKYTESNLFFGLENVEMLDGIATGKIAPREGDYDSMYEGGLEAELERLTEEADQYKGMATLIALECVNANRAYAEIAKGTDIETAFRMYGFEAEDGKDPKEAVSKGNIFKRAWQAIVGFFSNIISYLAHLLKIKRISGKVFDVIYADADKMEKKLAEYKDKATEKNDAKVALTKNLIENGGRNEDTSWGKVENVYSPDTLSNHLVPLEVGDEIKTQNITDFVKSYAKNFGISVGDDGKITEDEIEKKFSEHEEKLKLTGADEKDGEVPVSTAFTTVNKRLAAIKNRCDGRKGKSGSGDSEKTNDVIRDFEKAFEGCKKVHKLLQSKISEDKIPTNTSKEVLETLSSSLKAMGKLCARQAKVYNFCLRDFTTLTGYAIKDGAAVVAKLK